MVAGLKVQLSPAGRPEHESATGPLKPFVPVRERLSVALCPAFTETVDAAEVREKSPLPAGGAATAIEPKRPPLVPFTPAAKNKVFGSPTFLAPKTRSQRPELTSTF